MRPSPSAPQHALRHHQNRTFATTGSARRSLRDIGVRKMIIMSDATPRLANLPGYGLEIVDSGSAFDHQRKTQHRRKRLNLPRHLAGGLTPDAELLTL